MGRETDANRRELLRANRYEDAQLQGMVSNTFPAVLGELIQKKGISVMSIVENANVSKTYVNKLRNPSEKHVNPSRYVVIDIALAINATLNETNRLLKAARHQELYARNEAESVILSGLMKGKSGGEIRRMLQERGMDGIFKEK